MKINKLKQNILNKFNKNKGFVLLFSIVVSAIVLAIALGVSNIALKEINFSTSGQSSGESFYAADTGIECALYYDLTLTQSFGGPTEVFGTPVEDVVTKCGGTNLDLNDGSGTQIDPWEFVIPALGEFGNSCAVVEMYRYNVGGVEHTKITSRGYNLGGHTDDCTPATPTSKRVERVLEVNY